MHTYNRKPQGSAFAFLLAFLATAIGVLPLSGQLVATTPWKVSVGQVASVFGAISVGLIPTIFGINDGLPSCAPCDPATLPGIDRWAVSTENADWGFASSVVALGLAGGTWYELSTLSNGNANVAASVEATAWTYGVNELAKAVFNRNRPVLYSEDAMEARESVNSHRSMYSGHTSVSFALATSYFLSMSQKSGLGRSWPLFSSAVVGAMRLPAGNHFPTDILIGAVLGAATAIVVHEIRF
jgi:membrane-associated phospholipid phosphatase